MIGIIIVFVLMLTVTLTANINLGCGIIGSFILLFSGAIMHQLIEFKKDINKFTCPACTENSLCQKMCKSTKLYSIFSLFLAVLMSISLVSFLVSVEKFFIMIIGMDMFVFHYLFTHWNEPKSKQLVEDAHKVGSEIAINLFNILLLIIMLVALELMYIKIINFSSEIFVTVNDTVKHSCKIFQHILRTNEFIDLSMYATKNIDDIGILVFTFVYISRISLLPMLAITLLYKFGIKLQYRYF